MRGERKSKGGCATLRGEMVQRRRYAAAGCMPIDRSLSSYHDCAAPRGLWWPTPATLGEAAEKQQPRERSHRHRSEKKSSAVTIGAGKQAFRFSSCHSV